MGLSGLAVALTAALVVAVPASADEAPAGLGALPSTLDGLAVPRAPAATPAGSPWPVYPVLASDRVRRIAFQTPDPRHGGRQAARVLHWDRRGKISERWQNLDTGWANPFPADIVGAELPKTEPCWV